MEILTALGLLFFVISLIQKKEDLYAVPGIVPLFVFLSYILFQLLPLPPFIIEFLSPAAFSIQEKVFALTDNHSWMTLSVNHKATLSEFFRYGTYVMFYLLTVQLLKEKDTLQAVVLIIAVFGGLLAFSSILQFYLTKDMALWFRYSPDNSIIVGPYVNHNHYAGLMEMIFPIV
ncbi:MAG: lipid A core--O-antigen ligase, partial [Desulfobacula sp.]|nr:lipid A core--O-antigen ligase [Desulfobacula sp.]